MIYLFLFDSCFALSVKELIVNINKSAIRGKNYRSLRTLVRPKLFTKENIYNVI